MTRTPRAAPWARHRRGPTSGTSSRRAGRSVMPRSALMPAVISAATGRLPSASTTAHRPPWRFSPPVGCPDPPSTPTRTPATRQRGGRTAGQPDEIAGRLRGPPQHHRLSPMPRLLFNAMKRAHRGSIVGVGARVPVVSRPHPAGTTGSGCRQPLAAMQSEAHFHLVPVDVPFTKDGFLGTNPVRLRIDGDDAWLPEQLYVPEQVLTDNGDAVHRQVHAAPVDGHHHRAPVDQRSPPEDAALPTDQHRPRPVAPPGRPTCRAATGPTRPRSPGRRCPGRGAPHRQPRRLRLQRREPATDRPRSGLAGSCSITTMSCAEAARNCSACAVATEDQLDGDSRRTEPRRPRSPESGT